MVGMTALAIVDGRAAKCGYRLYVGTGVEGEEIYIFSFFRFAFSFYWLVPSLHVVRGC